MNSIQHSRDKLNATLDEYIERCKGLGSGDLYIARVLDCIDRLAIKAFHMAGDIRAVARMVLGSDTHRGY